MSPTQVLTTSEAQGLLYDTFLLISAGYKPMSDGVNLIDLMLPFEKRLVPLKEISRQISRVAVHISEDETLYKQWKVSVCEVIEDKEGNKNLKSDLFYSDVHFCTKSRPIRPVCFSPGIQSSFTFLLL